MNLHPSLSSPIGWALESVSKSPSPRFQISTRAGFSQTLVLETQVLTRPDHVIAQELRAISAVEAVFAERDAEGLLMVFVVVREHEEVVYELVWAAEGKIIERLGAHQFEFRIRAHQGRPPRRAVPVGSRPLFLR